MSPLVRVILLQMAAGLALSEGRLPLALVGERPLSAARALAEVPLVLVPDSELALFSNVHISAVSRSQPVVTCSLNSYSLDATPAVRVVLRRPLLVQSPEAALTFPARLSVLHEGLRMSLPVGALIAPVPALAGSHLIRVMYAVPTSAPLTLNYPYYSPVPYPFRPSYGESISTVAASPALPQPVRPAPHPEPDNQLVHKKPTPPLVTVLQFPDEIATPESLYYQPPVEDGLGNRNPPEAVIPAGIVQSAQPRPSLQVFLNSKESPLLQSLRDEAQVTQREKAASLNSISVEAL